MSRLSRGKKDSGIVSNAGLQSSFNGCPWAGEAACERRTGGVNPARGFTVAPPSNKALSDTTMAHRALILRSVLGHVSWIKMPSARAWC